MALDVFYEYQWVCDICGEVVSLYSYSSVTDMPDGWTDIEGKDLCSECRPVETSL